MKVKKAFSLVTAGFLSLSLLSACSGYAANPESVSIRLAHNQSEAHPIHTSITEFSSLIEEKSNDTVHVDVYSNGQLGGEREVIELVKAGTIDMAKVSASALEGFNKDYSIFSLPYVFRSQEHYYNVMENSEAVREIFEATRDSGFFAIGWYDGGQRSIYTADKKVESPADLNGLKIRVQQSPTAISMIEAMGGSPTPMSFGEVYTSLQQGVVDGAESNETALTNSNHGEVSKAYTYTEHQYVPDVLIVSTRKWNRLTEEQRQMLRDAAAESAESHKAVWAEAIEEAIAQAEEMGVTFYTIDKSAFIEASAPLHEEYKSGSEKHKEYFEDFQSHAQ